jgi:hypothetical protein
VNSPAPNDLGIIVGGNYKPKPIKAETVVDTNGVTAEQHMRNDVRHLTAEKISKIDGAATAIDLKAEAKARLDAVDALEEEISQASQERSDSDDALRKSINDETARAESAEGDLNTSLTEEVSRAKAAEQGLQDAIDDEIIRAQNAENEEAARAQNAEASLSQSMSDETGRAKAAESNLQSAITNEASRAGTAESELSQRITDETDARQSADADEAEARAAADNDLQSQLDSMKGQTRRFFLDFAAEFGTETPSKAQTDAWLAARTPIALTPSVGTAFKNSNAAQPTYNHLFVYYNDPADDGSLILSDDGVDTVSTASADSLGIVRGAGDASVDINGDLRLNANVATDTVIGNRTLSDNAASAALVAAGAKGLTAWLQGIRNNLKALFGYFTNGSANTAVKLAAKAKINVSGDATGTAQDFDGSADISIPVTLAAGKGTDTVIGNRTLTDNAANGTLVTVAAKTFTAWLQDIRDNLKDYFAHKANTSNPHSVSAEQVGLGNVTNTSDADKPVSTAQKTALDAKQNTALSAATTTALGLPAGTTAEAALIALSKRTNFIINMDAKIF